ncbi:hypothetical protein MALGJ_00030 [Mycolicibacter algericus]|uniref:PASTA domain-containing protein n=1 Tax=Mycolicibacter algericus TaxID=1288388 RepID=A0A7I9Y419_MYCAL|nr:hypothetical protein MALGJ_00030 [Mycolicibacter algericus]
MRRTTAILTAIWLTVAPVARADGDVVAAARTAIGHLRMGRNRTRPIRLLRTRRVELRANRRVGAADEPEQAVAGQPVNRNDLHPGDIIVYYRTPATSASTAAQAKSSTHPLLAAPSPKCPSTQQGHTAEQGDTCELSNRLRL